MRVMPIFGIILNMCCCDSDTTLSFLWSFIDCAIFEEIGKTLLGLSLCDSSR